MDVVAAVAVAVAVVAAVVGVLDWVAAEVRFAAPIPVHVQTLVMLALCHSPQLCVC